MHPSPFLRRGVAVAAAAAMIVAIAGCAAEPADDGDSSIAIRVTSLPHEDQWNWVLGGGYDLSAQAVYDSLFRFQGAGDVAPWLATEWEIADDGLSIDVTLHDEVTFTDGTPLDAEHVATYFEGVLQSDNAWATGFLRDQHGSQVEVTGENTLRFTTKIPLHDLWIRAMTNVPILPLVAVDDPEAFGSEPLGSGPYLLEDVNPGVSMAFVRNPDYWNADQFDFDRVTLVVFEDDIAALNALKSGQIDATDLDSTMAHEAEASGFTLSTASYVGNMLALVLNDRKGETVPALGDLRVRQALNMAFDRSSIVESLYSGFAGASSQPFPRNHIHYVEGGDDRYPFDLERARELLAEAGYPDGFDLTLAVDPSASIGQPIVEQTLGDLGIRVTWDQKVDLVTVLTDVDYPAALIKFPMLGAVDAFESVWGFSTAESAELDRIFKEAPPAESLEAAVELGEYILEDAWWVPLAQPDMVVASVPEDAVTITGYIINLEQYTLA